MLRAGDVDRVVFTFFDFLWIFIACSAISLLFASSFLFCFGCGSFATFVFSMLSSISFATFSLWLSIAPYVPDGPGLLFTYLSG